MRRTPEKLAELREWAKALPETDKEVDAIANTLPNNPLPQELADPGRILNKSELEDVRSALITSYGPNGRVVSQFEIS